MTSKAILHVFEEYQVARTKFVQSVAELASRPQNAEALQNVGALALLRPLLLDNVPSIQQSAALAIGRLASHSEATAESVISNDVLPQLVYSLAEQNRYFKKSAAFVLRNVAKHSPALAQAVADSGALEALVDCLGDFEPAVKEHAALALAAVARHGPELAQAALDAGAVSQLVLCVQEPELSLKRVAAHSIGELAKHLPDHAQAIVDVGAVSYLAPLLQHNDSRLKRHTCTALAHIAKHSVDMAEAVVEADVYPKLLFLLKDSDLVVRRCAATLVRETVKHTPELARLVVNCGGHGALVDFVAEEIVDEGEREVSADDKLPAIMALGYISAFSDTLASAVIQAHGVLALKSALSHGNADYVRAAAAWSLGQIGRHTPDHAKALAQADVLRKLVELIAETSVEGETKGETSMRGDLHDKALMALRTALNKCTMCSALEALMFNAPHEVLKLVLEQFVKILPNDKASRKSFVTSGCLEKAQQLKTENAPVFEDVVAVLNNLFPAEVVAYYQPDFHEKLIEKIDEIEP
ncbi:MAG: Sperm-associated antigen 6 [Cercozoa sp. M6MM]